MADAQLWSGIAQGFANIPGQMRERELKEAQIGEARQRQQLAQAQLEEYMANAPLRATRADLEFQQLQAETRKANSQALAGMTFGAFDRYEADKNVRHLNTWLTDAKNNPLGAKIYGPIARYDKPTTEHTKLLQQAGLDPNDQEDLDDHIIVTHADGNQLVVPIESIYAATGYDKYLSDEKLAEQERKARIKQLQRQGEPKSKATLKERIAQDLLERGEANTLTEAYRIVEEIDSTGSGGSGTFMDRLVKLVAEEEEVSNLEAYEKIQAAERAAGRGRAANISTEERAVEQIRKEAEEAGKPISYLEAIRQYHGARARPGAGTNMSRHIDNFLAINRDNIGPGKEYETVEEARAAGAADYANLRPTNAGSYVRNFVANNMDDIGPGKKFETIEEARIAGTQEYANLSETASEKNVDAAAEVYKQLDDIGWMDKDISEYTPRELSNIYARYIDPLIQYTGQNITQQDRNTLANLINLSALGTRAGEELTEEQTGFLDRFLRSTESYIFDEAPANQAGSLYAQFRNIARNALYGATVSGNEFKAFVDAAGTANLQLGPILSRLRTQLESVRNNLIAMEQSGNPYITKYFVGPHVSNINAGLAKLDQRIAEYSPEAIAKRAAENKAARELKVPYTGPKVDMTDPVARRAWIKRQLEEKNLLPGQQVAQDEEVQE